MILCLVYDCYIYNIDEIDVLIGEFCFSQVGNDYRFMLGNRIFYSVCYSDQGQ